MQIDPFLEFVSAHQWYLVLFVTSTFFIVLGTFVASLLAIDFVHNRFRYEHRLRMAGWAEDASGRIVRVDDVRGAPANARTSDSYYQARLTNVALDQTSQSIADSLIDALYSLHYWRRTRRQRKLYSRENMQLIDELGSDDNLTLDQVRERLARLDVAPSDARP